MVRPILSTGRVHRGGEFKLTRAVPEVCLPLLRELGLVRHFSLAQDQLAACRAELTQARLPQVSTVAAGQGVDSGYARYRRTAALADR